MTNDQYKEITGHKTYIKYKDLVASQTVIEDAVFLGTEINQFQRLNFLFDKDGVVFALPECGALKFNNNQGKMKTGMLYKIVYEGEGTIDKGAMKGKQFHKLKIFMKPSGPGITANNVQFEEIENQVPF